jgi:PAS domain S-box-containing protein
MPFGPAGGPAPGGSGSRMSLHTSLAVMLGALAVALVGQRRHRARWPVSAWLANLLIALAVAALVALAFKTVGDIARPLRLGTHTSLALLLLGAGTLLTRPEDRFLRMLFEGGMAGALARRLFFGVAIVPVVLTVLLLSLVQWGLLELVDGVVVLCVGLILCGFVIALFSTGAAVTIHEGREKAEQARLLLTARLQEQAAQLQETVGLRTRELREANASLRAAGESNALLALVAEHTTNGVIIADAAGRVEWVNSAFTRITGYTIEELRGRKPGHALQGPDSDPATIEKMRRAQERAEPCHVEVLNYTKAGRPFWAALDLQPVRDRNGNLAKFIALATDITEARAAQQRLERLNERLALATRAAALGVWEWDATTNRSQWDARTLEIYGVAASDYRGTSEDWIARLHPEDRDRMVAAFRALADDADGFEHEFRILRASDGAVRHIESRGVVQRDAQGRVACVTGTERDITAERDAAHQAAMLNERLRLALRSSNYGVWELDPATGRIMWDERMFELYGVSRAEFDGTRDVWRRRLHPDDCERAFAFAGKVISGEEPSYDGVSHRAAGWNPAPHRGARLSPARCARARGAVRRAQSRHHRAQAPRGAGPQGRGTRRRGRHHRPNRRLGIRRGLRAAHLDRRRAPHPRGGGRFPALPRKHQPLLSARRARYLAPRLQECRPHRAAVRL